MSVDKQSENIRKGKQCLLMHFIFGISGLNMCLWLQKTTLALSVNQWTTIDILSLSLGQRKRYHSEVRLSSTRACSTRWGSISYGRQRNY